MALLSWHYGPTADDPNPGSMWHYGCGGEVFFIDDGAICLKCRQQDDDPEADAESDLRLASPDRKV